MLHRAKMNRAFTLIELLIVVAIIAILAAIAVPNFLEAQVRAKVSRAQSDMRSLATAIGAYTVDCNKLPLDGDDQLNPLDMDYTQMHFFPKLTTPIAYITSIPMDPFNLKEYPDPYPMSWLMSPVPPTDPQFTYRMTAILFPGKPAHPYAYLTDGCNKANPANSTSTQPDNRGKPTTYGLTSLGPNQYFDSALNPDINGSYDPTNGTTSSGDIIRKGP